MFTEPLATVPALPAHECHVWWASPALVSSHLVTLLDDFERFRFARFSRKSDRTLYLASHVLARRVLGAYAGQSPAEVRFSRRCATCGGPHGKPHLQTSDPSIEFSISHSGDRVVMAAARNTSVGVDVELVASRPGTESLAKEALSPSERQALAFLPGTRRLLGLLTYWTRKEALLKATGHGLTIPPSSLTTTGLGQPPQLLSWPPVLRFGPRPQLYDLAPGAEHVACVALLGPTPAQVLELDGRAILAG